MAESCGVMAQVHRKNFLISNFHVNNLCIIIKTEVAVSLFTEDKVGKFYF